MKQLCDIGVTFAGAHLRDRRTSLLAPVEPTPTPTPIPDERSAAGLPFV